MRGYGTERWTFRARPAPSAAERALGPQSALKLRAPRPTTVAMEPIAATSGVSANVPATPKADAKARLGAFEDKLKAAGAKLEKVEGHAYAKVSGGTHDGRLLNTSGNERSGRLFEIVHRHGRTYHVYGSGSHRLFVGMPARTGGTQAPAKG
jgi:hypothetical protein